MKPFASLWFALVLSGCEVHNTCEVAGSIVPSVEIGTGEDAFVDLGDELPVQYGSQGGQHVWVSVRTTGIVASRAEPPTVRVSLEADGETLGEVNAWDPLRGNEEEAELPGISLQFWYDFPEGEPEAYFLNVEVEDSCGTVVSDRREVTLAW